MARIKQKTIEEMLRELDALLPGFDVVISSQRGRRRIKEVRI